MAEINPDVLAQMHRIHAATNDGTFNKDVINDALRLMHDYLSGVAYEVSEAAPEVEAHEAGHAPAVHSHRPSRKKR
jgi:hypothetical protein